MYTRKQVVWGLVAMFVLDLLFVGIPLGSLILMLAVIFRWKAIIDFLNDGMKG